MEGLLFWEELRFAQFNGINDVNERSEKSLEKHPKKDELRVNSDTGDPMSGNMNLNDAVYLPAVQRITKLAEGVRPVMIAIDGRCGSGKSTMGQWMQEHFDCNLFHMDDFYLPFADRIPGWEKIASANMDLGRFLDQVITPVKRGEQIVYKAYNAHKDLYVSSLIEPKQLNIVEGSYCHHPRLRGEYDMTIFLTCETAEQEARLRAREGDHFMSYQDRWIPLEERYFRQFAIEEKSDLVIHTDR